MPSSPHRFAASGEEGESRGENDEIRAGDAAHVLHGQPERRATADTVRIDRRIGCEGFVRKPRAKGIAGAFGGKDECSSHDAGVNEIVTIMLPANAPLSQFGTLRMAANHRIRQNLVAGERVVRSRRLRVGRSSRSSSE